MYPAPAAARYIDMRNVHLDIVCMKLHRYTSLNVYLHIFKSACKWQRVVWALVWALVLRSSLRLPPLDTYITHQLCVYLLIKCMFLYVIYNLNISIYMYIKLIYIYIQTYAHTCIHTCVHIRTQTYIQTDKHTYKHKNMLTYIQTYMYTYKHTHIHTCTYTYIHTSIQTYICIYICICDSYVYVIHVCM